MKRGRAIGLAGMIAITGLSCAERPVTPIAPDSVAVQPADYRSPE